jgi:hypothetical protein
MFFPDQVLRTRSLGHRASMRRSKSRACPLPIYEAIAYPDKTASVSPEIGPAVLNQMAGFLFVFSMGETKANMIMFADG